MHVVSKTAAIVATALVCAAGAAAQPGSGILWELTMHVEGMPEGMSFGMPPRTQCMAKDTNVAPPADHGCTILEQSSNGNHHVIKSQCSEGIVEIDQTRTDSTLTQHMRMTDASGTVSEMVMRGRRLEDCDYSAAR